jgi:histidyl-tRNA synthetase
VQRVIGARDHLPLEAALRRSIVDELDAAFGEAGYTSIELPIVEPTELYVRKAGGSLLAKLYSFDEPGGGRVSLRPEFTASVVRCYLQTAGLAGQPARWRYAGPVFRFDPGSTVRMWSQSGVEAIGVRGDSEDAALLGLALDGLDRLRMGPGQIVLGHVGVFREAIEGFGLSERTTATILDAIELLVHDDGAATLRRQLAELGLTASDPQAVELKEALKQLGEAGAQTVVRGLLESINVDLLGGRHPDEIVGRLLRKLSGWDEPQAIDRAIAFAVELARLKGPARRTLDRARELFRQRSLSVPSVDGVEMLVASLEQRGAPEPTVDFGLSRELGYYSGFVFELRTPDSTFSSVCGGGRYDGLVRSIGGPDIPAAGFAFNVDALAELAEARRSASIGADR